MAPGDAAACWHCGYSRAGLAAGDACPECGSVQAAGWKDPRVHWLTSASFLFGLAALLTPCLGLLGTGASAAAVCGGAWVLTHRGMWRGGRDESLAWASVGLGAFGLVVTGVWAVVVLVL